MSEKYEALRKSITDLRTKALAEQIRLPRRTAEEARLADVVRHLTSAGDIVRKLLGGR